MPGPINRDLLDVLVCPITRSKLRQDGDELVSEAEGLRYPIRDGMPVLLPDEATPPDGQCLDAIKSKYGVMG